jgi:hypothetical protein
MAERDRTMFKLAQRPGAERLSTFGWSAFDTFTRLIKAPDVGIRHGSLFAWWTP